MKHAKNISYLGARKFIENSLVTTTYANIVKPTNNFTQNQGMTTHFDMTNLIKELKTLLKLLRESLTNLTTKPHAGPDPKKNLHPHSNKTEDPPKLDQTITQPKPQAPDIPLIITKPNHLPPKKLDNTESPLLMPKKRSPWKKESNKHKPLISLIETENKFELMETELRKSSKQRNPKYPKSLKIRSKKPRNFWNFWIQPNEKQNTKTETTPKQNKHQTHRLKSMAYKIIQWNCRGYKANNDKLLRLIAELNPTAICLQETFKKQWQTKHKNLWILWPHTWYQTKSFRWSINPN